MQPGAGEPGGAGGIGKGEPIQGQEQGPRFDLPAKRFGAVVPVAQMRLQAQQAAVVPPLQHQFKDWGRRGQRGQGLGRQLLGRGVAQLPAEGLKRRAVRLAAVARHIEFAGIQGPAQDGVLLVASDQLKAVGRLLDQGPGWCIHAPSRHGGCHHKLQGRLRGRRPPFQKNIQLEHAMAGLGPGEPVQMAGSKANGLGLHHGPAQAQGNTSGSSSAMSANRTGTPPWRWE